MSREKLLRRGTASQREAWRNTRTETLAEQTPNAWIKRRRSRPLEWDVRRLRRCMLGRQRLPTRDTTWATDCPKITSSECPGLRRYRAKKLLRRRTTSQRETGRNTPYDKPTRAAD